MTHSGFDVLDKLEGGKGERKKRKRKRTPEEIAMEAALLDKAKTEAEIKEQQHLMACQQANREWLSPHNDLLWTECGGCDIV